MRHDGTPRDQEAGITHLIPHSERGTDAQAVFDSLRDPALFATVFERHFASVHRYAQQRVGVDSADEIAAETFLVAFDSRRRFDARRTSARPWLLGIATNLIRRVSALSQDVSKTSARAPFEASGKASVCTHTHSSAASLANLQAPGRRRAWPPL